MPGSTGLIFWWLIWGSWRKDPFDDRSCNMAATAAILDLGFRRLSDERLSTGPIFRCLIGGHQSSPCSTSP
jgi:hypothetical protein